MGKKRRKVIDGVQPRFYLLIFYIAVRKFQKWKKRRHKKAFMKKHGVDLCCPGCLTWTSERPWIKQMVESEMHWHITCQKCGTISHWGLWAPVPILDKSFKGPVAECDAADCNSEGEG